MLGTILGEGRLRFGRRELIKPSSHNGNDNVMSVLIISHSYMNAENQKNIVALRKYIPVRVAIPDWFKSRMFRRVQHTIISELRDCIRAFKVVRFLKSQFILRPLGLDLSRQPTALINIEYDPWGLIFWKTLIARNRTNPAIKLVCTVKSNTYTQYRGLFGWLKYAIAMKGISAVDNFLTCSQKVAQIYHERFHVPWDKMVPCYHLGVDTDLFSPGSVSTVAQSGRGLTVGYCGRFDADKGVMNLIEAVRKSRGSLGSDLQLHLLGRGTLEGAIVEMAKTESWIKRFEPVPHGEVPHFLRKLDMFVLPSMVLPEKEEHDAHALAEALAMGLPCIGTQSGITPELIGDGTGIVVPANSMAALADAIVRLSADGALRGELGRKGRQKALREWSIESLAKKKAAIFKRLGCEAT